MLRMSMKMAAASTITLLLLCCLTFADSEECDHNVIVGGTFSVPLNHKKAFTGRLEWAFKGKNIFRRRPPGVIVSEKNYSVDEDGNLMLTNIQMDLAGTYKPEAFDESGVLVKDLKSTRLCVFEHLDKPSVTIQCSSDKSSNQVKFTCKVNQPENSSIKWNKNSKYLIDKKGTVLTEDAKMVEKDFFTCNISNPAMSITSDPVTQTCYKSSIFPEKVLGVSIWVFVGSGAGIVLILIITVIICCVHAKRKKHTHKMDEEELRLGWTNTEQQEQQHHHHHHNNHQHQRQHHQHNHPPDHHHHHQQQPAGHTGPRQNRSKQHREPRLRAPGPPNGQPQPSPRRNPEGPRPAFNNDDEQPPPLPQPRKKAPKV